MAVKKQVIEEVIVKSKVTPMPGMSMEEMRELIARREQLRREGKTEQEINEIIENEKLNKDETE